MMEKLSIPFSELNFSFSRSSGAGGQNVNKVNSKVILYWNPKTSSVLNEYQKERFLLKYAGIILESGEVQVISQEHRSQKMNQDTCIEKLIKMIESIWRAPKARKATKPKRSAVLKRLDSKKKDGLKKQMRRKDY